MPVAALTETQNKAALTIGRAIWSDAHKKQAPKASKEDKLASWKQNRVAYVRLGRLAVRRLVKTGIKV